MSTCIVKPIRCSSFSTLFYFGITLYILDSKLSPCSKCYMLSSGLFPGVWILCADVSEHSVCSIFIGRWLCEEFRRRGITQKKAYNTLHVLDGISCYLLASEQVAVHVWRIPVAVCTVLNSWWWTGRPP